MLILVAILAAGFGLYVVRWIIDGDDWAAFPVNYHTYTNGILSTGAIVDTNGVVLAGVDSGHRTYNDSELVRRATLHVVGDLQGNIGSGLLHTYEKQLMDYNLFSGVYSLSGAGNTLHTTLDSRLCSIAYQAMNGRRGAVAVINYKTGAVVCMVSTPGFDPLFPPDASNVDNPAYNGVYINRAVSSTFTPGSVFKLITLEAALEQDPAIWDRTFHCDGSFAIGQDVITCTSVHGDLDIRDALAKSCNCAFAQLALDVGNEAIRAYAEKAGLLDSFYMGEIRVAAGFYGDADAGSSDLAWAGIGQYNDLVNPLALARYVGAIANGGSIVTPRIIESVTSPVGLPRGLYLRGGKTRLLAAGTADTLKEMMLYNVTSYYGAERFPGLPIGAKSGTAEIEQGDVPHSWFVGFLDDPSHPYAFAVLLENSGWGMTAAGGVANEVLQELMYPEN